MIGDDGRDYPLSGCMGIILLVEDNAISREMLARRLTRKNFIVELAVDGREALTKVNERRPDLILMDLSLPGLDGWETTRRLKAQEHTRGIPVIILTAHALEQDRLKALETGCDDFDTKPVDFVRLMSKVDRLLSRGRP